MTVEVKSIHLTVFQPFFEEMHTLSFKKMHKSNNKKTNYKKIQSFLSKCIELIK